MLSVHHYCGVAATCRDSSTFFAGMFGRYSAIALSSVSNDLRVRMADGDDHSLPEWVGTNYPSLAPTIHALAQLLRSACFTNHSEFELRLGTDNAGHFISDVGFAVHDDLLRQCSSNTSGQLVFQDWVQHVNYYFTVNGTQLRTRTIPDPSTLELHSTCIHKLRKERVEVRCTGTPWRVRADLSVEEPVSPETLPDTVLPDRVSLVHRSSGTYQGSQDQAPSWRYDLSVTWSGRTRAEAESNQRRSDLVPEYMVELEYIGGPEAVARCGAEYVACSGLLKILDVIGMAGASCSVMAPHAPNRLDHPHATEDAPIVG